MMRYLLSGRILVVFLGFALPYGEVAARIKLITLPARERVEVQLDHPRATLVEEERRVPLVKGLNQVDFSWANTRIDADSIVFRVLGGAARGGQQVKVLAVSYPPGENALVWSVYASRPGSARVRISYLLGKLDKSFNYRAIASRDEQRLVLSQYLKVRNLANESFGQSGISIGYGERLVKPIGLNETREMLIRRYPDVPIHKTYTADLSAIGYQVKKEKKLRVAMHYRLENDKAHGLGEAPLPYGKVRIFQQDGHGGSAFLGEDWGKFTAPGDLMSLYLGVARDVVVKRTIERNKRRRVDGNLFHRDVVVRYEVENFKSTAVTLDVVENLAQLSARLLGGQRRGVEWELGKESNFPGGPDKEKTRAERIVLHAPLPAANAGKAKKKIYKLHLVLKNEW